MHRWSRLSRTPFFAICLSLLLPGAGHIWWREVAFGIFIFLITILAAAVAFVNLLIPLPLAAQIPLLGLPLIFYLASFIDLHRTIRRKRGTTSPIPRYLAISMLLGAVVYQLVAPTAPGAFLIANRPVWYRQSDNSAFPLARTGDWISAQPVAYSARVNFLPQRIWYALPQRGEWVTIGSSERRTVLVVARPGERVGVRDGLLIADGQIVQGWLPTGVGLTGDWDLRDVGAGSILVATLSTAQIRQLIEVPLEEVVGRADPLL